MQCILLTFLFQILSKLFQRVRRLRQKYFRHLTSNEALILEKELCLLVYPPNQRNHMDK